MQKVDGWPSILAKLIKILKNRFTLIFLIYMCIITNNLQQLHITHGTTLQGILF